MKAGVRSACRGLSSVCSVLAQRSVSTRPEHGPSGTNMTGAVTVRRYCTVHVRGRLHHHSSMVATATLRPKETNKTERWAGKEGPIPMTIRASAQKLSSRYQGSPPVILSQPHYPPSSRPPQNSIPPSTSYLIQHRVAFHAYSPSTFPGQGPLKDSPETDRLSQTSHLAVWLESAEL